MTTPEGRDDAPPTKVRSALRHNRPLTWLVVSILFHRLSGSMLLVAIPFFTIDRYGLGVETGLALGARLLPNILFGMVVGHIVDKWEPRTVAWVTSIINAVLIGLIPLTQSVIQLQILMFTTGIVYMFGVPARMSLRPLVIPEEQETAGNAALVTAERLSSVVGPTAVGIIIGVVGVGYSFPVQAVITCLGAAAMLGLPRREPQTVPEPSGGFRENMRDELRQMFVSGPTVLLRVVTSDPMLRVLVITGFTYVAAVSIGEIFVVQLAKENFSTFAGANGWLIGALGAGGVIGAVASAPLGRFHQGRLFFFGNVLEGFAWLSLPWVGLPVALLMMVIAGILESVATVVYFAEVQRRLPRELTGRFYAAFLPLTDACAMLGVMAAPLVLAAAGVESGAIIIAALMIIPVLLCGRTLLSRQKQEAPLMEPAVPSRAP